MALLRVVKTQAILFLKSISERGGSDMEWLWNWISRSTQNRLKLTSFKFIVVLCRIRLFPTLISKIKGLGSGPVLTCDKNSHAWRHHKQKWCIWMLMTLVRFVISLWPWSLTADGKFNFKFLDHASGLSHDHLGEQTTVNYSYCE